MRAARNGYRLPNLMAIAWPAHVWNLLAGLNIQDPGAFLGFLASPRIPKVLPRILGLSQEAPRAFHSTDYEHKVLLSDLTP